MTPDDEGFEPGVGCRTVLSVLGVFVLLAFVGGVLFFTGDPDAIPFWRRWVLGTTLPVSGLLVGLGAAGLAWSLDLLALAGISAWAARAEDGPTVRRRVGYALGALALLGLFSASLA